MCWKKYAEALQKRVGKIALRKQEHEKVMAIFGLTGLAETWSASFVSKSLFNSTVYAFVDGAQK